jgi:hypothetical protein
MKLLIDIFTDIAILSPTTRILPMQVVINTHGTLLHREGEGFLIQAGAKQLALSGQKIQSIVLATAATGQKKRRRSAHPDLSRQPPPGSETLPTDIYREFQKTWAGMSGFKVTT